MMIMRCHQNKLKPKREGGCGVKEKSGREKALFKCFDFRSCVNESNTASATVVDVYLLLPQDTTMVRFQLKSVFAMKQHCLYEFFESVFSIDEKKSDVYFFSLLYILCADTLDSF